MFTRAKDMIMQAIHFLCYLFSTKLKKKLLKKERIIFSYFKFVKDRKEKGKFLFSFFDPILKILQQQQQKLIQANLCARERESENFCKIFNACFLLLCIFNLK